MENNVSQEYITIKEASLIAQVCDKTIRNWISENKITAEYSKGLRKWRILKRSLLNYIEYK